MDALHACPPLHCTAFNPSFMGFLHCTALHLFHDHCSRGHLICNARTTIHCNSIPSLYDGGGSAVLMPVLSHLVACKCKQIDKGRALLAATAN
jgi:hypothetical protein